MEQSGTITGEIKESIMGQFETIYSVVIQLARPFIKIFPSVTSPGKNIGIQEKLIWTVLAILVYTVASQVPLYGIINTQSSHSSGWLKSIMAANRGTIMDLGISPVVTGSMIMNFLTGSRFIVVDHSIAEDKILFDVFQKLVTLVVVVVQGFIQVYSGYYGPVANIPLFNKFMLFTQLSIAGIMMILLDDMLSNGYGYGNGINLFIVSSSCGRLLWSALSPRVFHTARGLEFEGCLISLVYAIFKRQNKIIAIKEVLFRQNLPNLLQFLFTILVFSFVVYIQQLRLELLVYSVHTKGVNEIFPIPLIYTSSTPVILQGQIFSNICFFSKFFYGYFPNNMLIRFLGVWENSLKKGLVPVSGISYYLTGPDSFTEGFSKPFNFLIYIFLTLTCSALLAKNWTENHNESARSVYNKFKNQGIKIKGVRESNMFSILNSYISVASILSGVTISSIMIFCDLTSTYGSGSNVILAVSIIQQYAMAITENSVNSYGKISLMAARE